MQNGRGRLSPRRLDPQHGEPLEPPPQDRQPDLRDATNKHCADFVDGGMAVFGRLVPEGWLPVPRDTSAHLATFLEVFKVVHSYGTETSSEASRAIR